jgi:hypothetical protein
VAEGATEILYHIAVVISVARFAYKKEFIFTAIEESSEETQIPSFAYGSLGSQQHTQVFRCGLIR